MCKSKLDCSFQFKLSQKYSLQLFFTVANFLFGPFGNISISLILTYLWLSVKCHPFIEFAVTAKCQFAEHLSFGTCYYEPQSMFSVTY